MNTWRDYTRFGKALLVAAVPSVLLLFAAVPRSLAPDDPPGFRGKFSLTHSGWVLARLKVWILRRRATAS